jgi:DNA-binding response OmpR family regulator
MAEGIKILLVDDEVKLLETLSKRLRKRRHEVAIAESGMKALEHLENQTFDVIVLDIRMPGMDGIETLRQIKRRFPQPEVILLTGHASVASGIDGVRLGAFDYLLKPIDFEVLLEKLEAAYENKSRIDRGVRRAEVERDRGVRIEEDTVREVMNQEFPRLVPDSTIADAVELLRRRQGATSLDELYVVNEGQELLGKVRRRHILAGVLPVLQESNEIAAGAELSWSELLEKGCGRAGGLPVSRVMEKQTKSLSADAKVIEAAEFMMDNNLTQVPVLEAMKMVGVVQMFNILVFISDMMVEAL